MAASKGVKIKTKSFLPNGQKQKQKQKWFACKSLAQLAQKALHTFP
jgi:hypothetical protein